MPPDTAWAATLRRICCIITSGCVSINRQASDAELCASFEKIERVRGAAFSGTSEVPLTYFEFGTLAAMQCFIEHKVDVAILEVGLGGRLDAVNVFEMIARW